MMSLSNNENIITEITLNQTNILIEKGSLLLTTSFDLGSIVSHNDFPDLAWHFNNNSTE